MKKPYVYILANQRNGTLYVGVTSDLVTRVSQHKAKQIKGFTYDYNITRLVWCEAHATMEDAIRREKAIKKWNRLWKLRLIEEANPEWDDLYEKHSW